MLGAPGSCETQLPLPQLGPTLRPWGPNWWHLPMFLGLELQYLLENISQALLHSSVLTVVPATKGTYASFTSNLSAKQNAWVAPEPSLYLVWPSSLWERWLGIPTPRIRQIHP